MSATTPDPVPTLFDDRGVSSLHMPGRERGELGETWVAFWLWVDICAGGAQHVPLLLPRATTASRPSPLSVHSTGATAPGSASLGKRIVMHGAGHIDLYGREEYAT